MKDIIIHTDRLTLTPLGSQYLRTVCGYAMDAENTKYMYYLPHGSEEEAAEFLQNAASEWEKESPDYFEFAILYEGEHVGAVSLYLEQDAGELGWIIARKYWRRGFAHEAAEAVIRYFAENRGISRFMARCDTENIASYRVMEKLGMTRTGEYGGRKNRSAARESREYRYELEYRTER